MHRRFLLAWGWGAHDPVVRSLSRAALAGDASALPCLWDRLQETPESGMQSLKVGEAYLIHGSDRIYTGRVKSVSLTDVVLGEAASLAYYGPLHELLRTGAPPHVDPLPDEVIISTGMILFAVRWDHPLPREPKGTSDTEIPF
jgi:hypothetical protein